MNGWTQQTQEPAGVRGWAPRWVAVGAATVMLATLWAAANLTARGQELDAGAFHHVSWAQEQWGGAAAVARQWLPVIAAAGVAALAAVQIARRAWRPLLDAAGIVISSAVLAVLGRALLGRPDLGGYGYPYNTFPSVNVAVVAALCVAAWSLLPSPSRWVGLVIGIPIVLTAAASSVVTYAHRPSDVVGSLLLVGVVTGLSPATARAGT